MWIPICWVMDIGMGIPCIYYVNRKMLCLRILFEPSVRALLIYPNWYSYIFLLLALLRALLALLLLFLFYFFISFIYCFHAILSTNRFTMMGMCACVCGGFSLSLSHRQVAGLLGHQRAKTLRSTHSYLRQITISFSHQLFRFLYFVFFRALLMLTRCCCHSVEWKKNEKKNLFYSVFSVRSEMYGCGTVWRDDADVRGAAKQKNILSEKQRIRRNSPIYITSTHS